VDSKPAAQSQTIIAAVVAIIASLLSALGHPIGDATTTDLITTLAGIWAIYGRYKAAGPISGIIK
jgi:flagellar motor component MotA